MEKHFKKFKKNVIGNNLKIKTPYGKKKLLYADWIASGRLYAPIEKQMNKVFGPWVANTHTETAETGTLMTKSYHWAQKLIKQHVNAGENDVIISAGSGMTSVISKLQRFMGLKGQQAPSCKCPSDNERPVVFITHMEHHSNQTSWYETNVDVVIIPPGDDLLVDLNKLRGLLQIYKDRQFKIGSFSACSNVTGIILPVHEMAKIMHEYGGVCFIDYAASAPYVDINMHPEDPMEKLDAIFFSPHKFLGGPGTPGILVFDSSLYTTTTPDNPGGGTVDWTNPWGEYKYIDDIETREDGGTPPFLQTIRAALSIEVKNQMGTRNIHKRETQLTKIAFKELRKIEGLHILADNVENRLGIFSFYLEGIHFNLVVKLLNDRFGIQVRGGCACAGTYGHYLLDVSYDDSHEITKKINSGDLTEKPGWIRLSLHPIMTNKELHFTIEAIKQVNNHHKEWAKDYIYNNQTNEFRHKHEPEDKTGLIKDWFKL